MRYRKLGATGITVSEIGFGTWGLGGAANGAVAYGPTDDAQSTRALRSALDHGINFFDTADLYGFGHSEIVLGQALRDVRRHVVIATKAGFLGADGAQDFSRGHLRRALDASLTRLGTDYIDLFQLHDPPMKLLEQDPNILESLIQLQREGLIRAYGVSARSPNDALVAVNQLGFRCVQVNFNLADQRAIENGLLDFCARVNAGVVVRTPLSFGFLTGRYTADTQFDLQDHRNRWSAEQRQRWIDSVQKLLPVSSGRDQQTHAQLALRFCLSFPAVATVIPGMLSDAHVRENAAASDLGALPEVECAAIVDAYREQSFFLSNR
jgi:aryl-alcohol dehydrogenase-like predicted oxidoreductase